MRGTRRRPQLPGAAPIVAAAKLACMHIEPSDAAGCDNVARQDTFVRWNVEVRRMRLETCRDACGRSSNQVQCYWIADHSGFVAPGLACIPGELVEAPWYASKLAPGSPKDDLPAGV